MKKLIAAIVIASMGAAFAEAPTIVYDYKASIKRLDLQLKYVKKSNAVAQNFKVVSDTIQGYVTLPLCDNCLPDDQVGIESTDQFVDFIDNDSDYSGYAYLTLKGNKYAKDYKRVVLKTPAYAMAGVFGSDAWVTSTQPIDAKKNTKAWMALDYSLHNTNFIADFDVSPVLKNQISIINPETGEPDYMFLGFLGIGHVGNNQVQVQNTGFGTAKVVTQKTAATASLCGGLVPGEEYNCTIVNTISGTLVGYPWYLGACAHNPMWDICLVSVIDEQTRKPKLVYRQVANSVISGTWSLKYNSKLSDAGNKEEAILKALKVTDAKAMYEVNVNGGLKSGTFFGKYYTTTSTISE